MTDGQPFLPGLEPTRGNVPPAAFGGGGLHRFFFALRPNQAAADQASLLLQNLRRRYRLTGTTVKRENLHVTLHPFGECDEPPANLGEVASRFAQAIQGKPFEIVLDRAMSFRRRGGYCLVLGGTRGVAGIYNLQRQLVLLLEHFLRAGTLTPHMTLLYADKFVEKQTIESIRWTVNEFVLIHSFIGQGRHEIVARWPLR